MLYLLFSCTSNKLIVLVIFISCTGHWSFYYQSQWNAQKRYSLCTRSRETSSGKCQEEKGCWVSNYLNYISVVFVGQLQKLIGHLKYACPVMFFLLLFVVPNWLSEMANCQLYNHHKCAKLEILPAFQHMKSFWFRKIVMFTTEPIPTGMKDENYRTESPWITISVRRVEQCAH